MAAHKAIGKICCVVLVLTLLLTVLFLGAVHRGAVQAETTLGYADRLFDASVVHTIDLVMDDWDGFLSTCTSEEYTACAAVIDGEAYKNIAIRAKGNTSLTQVAQYGNQRYSFKIEFDHYDSAKSYYGLDKLSLNNIIQDNTYMKDFLCYQLMGKFGVDAPLCSFVSITVNGEDWGLYLAVEGVEEAFLQRNYGADYGALYKPDSQSMGGGRGNGGQFDMDAWDDAKTAETGQDAADGIDTEQTGEAPAQTVENSTVQAPEQGQRPVQQPDGMSQERGGEPGMGSAAKDVSLIYTDDDEASYSNIFDNAKTDVTEQDKTRLIAALKALSEQTELEQTVDVDEVIRYFVVHNFVCNFDSYTGSMIHNYYLYEKDGRLSMIPWDYNLAFGGFGGAQDATSLVNYPIDTPVSGGTVDSRPMLAWIFAEESYTTQYHKLFAEFLTQFFDSGELEALIDDTVSLIAPYVEKDPTKFCTYEEFESGVQTLKTFCLLRAESVRGQLDGSIASTSEGQAQSSDGFVDASSIQISDMGSMGGGNGGNPGQMMPPSGWNGDGGGTPPSPPDGQSGSDGANGAAPGGAPPAMPGQETQNGTASEGDASASEMGRNAALLAACGVVLLLAIGIAWRYRKNC